MNDVGLKIKKFQDVFNSLVTWLTADESKLTDFNVGSALRTLTEAVSLQVEEFYFNMKQNVEYAIDSAIYTAFGFEKINAENAYGFINIEFVKPLETVLIIPEGFTVSTSFSNSKVVYYKALDDTEAPIGSTSIMVKVTCTEPGTIGNCEEGEINNLITGNTLIKSVSNPTRISTGIDAESSSDTKARFKSYLKSLGRATRDSLAYGAKSVEGVDGVYVDDNYIGFVNVYCHDANGELPESLKSRVEIALEEYRAGGIEVRVLPVVRKEINVKSTIVLRDTVDVESVKSSIDLMIKNYLNNYRVSTDFYVADIITLVMSEFSEVVLNIEPNGLENVQIMSNAKVVAGEVDTNCVKLMDWR